MEGKFEEVDDAFLDEWADVPEMIKEVQDCSFAKIYGPIRALFATESVVLSKFEDCLDHMERLDFLLKMEVRLTWHCRNLCKACFNGKIGWSGLKQRKNVYSSSTISQNHKCTLTAFFDEIATISF